jgi:hypothetical protein
VLTRDGTFFSSKAHASAVAAVAAAPATSLTADSASAPPPEHQPKGHDSFRHQDTDDRASAAPNKLIESRGAEGRASAYGREQRRKGQWLIHERPAVDVVAAPRFSNWSIRGRSQLPKRNARRAVLNFSGLMAGTFFGIAPDQADI